MPEERGQVGCGAAVASLVATVIAFFIGLSLMPEPRRWWHYVLALPIGVVVFRAFSC